MRRIDHDRFLSVLFAAEQDREHLFALYAFNIEIARIPGQVSEPMLGEIRLQWWREGIEAVYDGATMRVHPVLQPLEQAIRARSLPRRPFDAMIDAYSAALTTTQPASLAELETRQHAISGGVMRLAAEITGGGEMADTGLPHAAIAWGLCGILRNIGFHASQQHIILPGDVMNAEGVTAQSILGCQNSPELQKVIKAMALRAESHMAAARKALPPLPRQNMAALLPATLTKLYLRQMSRPDYDPFAVRPPLPAFQRQSRMAWAMWRRRI